MIETSETTPRSPQLKAKFSAVDYYFFGGMLGMSILIGIYFGFVGRKKNNKNEYLMGGRTMSVVPIAVSLIASHTSGLSLLSVPADIYRYGPNYIFISISVILSFLGCSYIFLPVFHKLQLTSSFEYLCTRFDKKVRIFASLLNALGILLSGPLVIYIPALAFSQATDINIHIVSSTICAICVFYTTFGGIKAVVWADTLQTIVMAISLVIVFALGIISSGGFWSIINVARKSQRFDLEFGLSPTLRDSFWVFIVGATFHWTNNTIAQVTIQRLLTVPTKTEARRVITLSCIGIVFIKFASVFTGLIMYAKYSLCDPLLSKQIIRTDEMLPYYVLNVAKQIPGLSGLFISGILGASLSTLSGGLNTLAATVYEDFILPCIPNSASETKSSYILKLIVVVAGIISTALIFVMENLGGLLPLGVSVHAITGGTLLGLFSLGMLFPLSNAKGALFGGIGGLLFTSCLVIGNIWYKNQEFYTDPVKPLSVDGCSFPVNTTFTRPHSVEEQQTFYLFQVSFWYFTMMGTIVTIIIGLIVSYFTRKDSEFVHPDLLSPILNIFSIKQAGIKAADKTYENAENTVKLLTYNTKDVQDK